MAHPVYVLLPEGVEWTGIAGTTAQRPGQVRWYLRQRMPMASTQTAVLVDEGRSSEELRQRVELVARAATALGGMAVDASTQLPIDPDRVELGDTDRVAAR